MNGIGLFRRSESTESPRSDVSEYGSDVDAELADDESDSLPPVKPIKVQRVASAEMKKFLERYVQEQVKPVVPNTHGEKEEIFEKLVVDLTRIIGQFEEYDLLETVRDFQQVIKAFNQRPDAKILLPEIRVQKK